MTPHRSSAPARRRAICLATAAALLACGSDLFADVTRSLGPTAALSATQLAQQPDVIWFDLIAMNDADAPADFTFPGSLNCRITTPDGAVDREAQIGRAGVGTVALPAHGFIRMPYRATLTTAGRVIVELADGSAAGTVLTLVPGEAAVTSNARNPQPAPARNPIEAVVQRDPNYRSEMGLVEYLAYRIKPHEPVYILGGGEDPELKFQFSFKYQVFDPNGDVAQKVPPLAGLYFGYSQTSYWDIDGVSNPFYDTSYRPEGLLSYDNLDNELTQNGERILPDWLRLGFQAGVKHESNGRDGDDSRSLNIVYARPIVTFSGEDGWFLTVAPSVFTYFGDLSDNPDIDLYRGHADLRLVIGQGGGVQLAAIGRLGDDFDKGSLELDLSVPIRQLTFGNFDVYLHTQYFTGYGESLLNYNERDDSLRFGISLVR